LRFQNTPPFVHVRPNRLARKRPKHEIFCVSDVYGRYDPDLRERAGGCFKTLNKRGDPKSQFLVGRLWCMTPHVKIDHVQFIKIVAICDRFGDRLQIFR